ncbi:hypothetical protein [Nocardia brasiliensis]|uniref:hypothetical protein n=1 Tax=Nocardia brasiliensis TaxID=37326 RepID=UPI002458FA3B|nr:hypothetical protein [Nocardia brasiliensis]
MIIRTRRGGGLARWEQIDWDRWTPWAGVRRCRAWLTATRRGRVVLWLWITVLGLFVFPGALGAIATAQSSKSAAPGTSSNSALSWMNVRDSDGVEMSQYFLAQDNGGFLEPGTFFIATLTGCVMVGWAILTITPIHLIGSALSFSWMDSFEQPLRDLSDSYTRVIVTPPILLFSASIGAFFAMYFFIRGFHAKAVYQIIFMLGVAVLAPALLLDPMSRVFSSNGLLGMGRDFGLAVASGLNGEVGTNPDELIARTQMHMADNFGRKPLQVWNFGHVVDQRPACRTAWSRGIESGDTEQVRRGMELCQDLTARDAIDNPTWGQLGTGIMLGASSMIFLLFALYLAFKVVRAVFDVIFNVFVMIVGLGSAGFIYGPPQVALIQSLVGVGVSSVEMSLYTMLLGSYMFLNGSIFSRPDGGVPMLIMGAFLHVVFIMRARQIARAMRGAEQWVSNRFAQKLQDAGGKGGGGGGGGGGGTALGMGSGSSSSATLQTLAGLSMVAAISNSPLAGRLFRTHGNPFAFGARYAEGARRGQAMAWNEIPDEYADSYRSFGQLRDIAGASIRDPRRFRGSGIPADLRIVGDMSMNSVIGRGGRDSYRGVAQVLNSVTQESGYKTDRALSAVLRVSRDPRHNARMIAAWERVEAKSNANPVRFKPLADFRAATDEYLSNPNAVSLSILEQKGANLVGAYTPQVLTGGLQTRADAYLNAPNKKELAALWEASNLSPDVDSTVSLGGVGVKMTAEEAGQVMNYIGYTRSVECLRPVNEILGSRDTSPASVARLRRRVSFAEREDMWAAGVNRSPATPSSG